MTGLECDVAIIGAGTAGLTAERNARRAGARTLLIDDRFAGTTCATAGCMPSKLLIAAARAAHAVHFAGVFGVATEKPRIDGAAVMSRLRRERDAFVAGTLKTIAQIPNGIRIQAHAHFVDQKSLVLDDGRYVHAKAVVIATGSRPHIPAIFAALGDRILTNETLFDLGDFPKSIAVIGAGPLGLEMAQALVRLGVETHVFDQGSRLAGLNDAPVALELKAILERELPIRLGVSLSAERDGNGAILSWTGSSSGAKRFDRVLVAAGRPPQLAGLKLESAGLVLDHRGAPHFDPHTMQCGDASIFIAGDADADRPVLHEASSEGAIAGRNAASFPLVHAATRNVAFSIMFTDPPLAVLGGPPGAETVIGCASYADQGRAKIEACNVGLVRIYAARPDGRLIGAAMAGPAMDHIAHLMAWAIDRKETATALLNLPFYHPTFEEGLKPALREICDAVHSSVATDRDEGDPPGA